MESVTKTVFRVTWGSGYDMIEQIIVADSYESCLNYLRTNYYKKEDPDMIQILYESARVV